MIRIQTNNGFTEQVEVLNNDELRELMNFFGKFCTTNCTIRDTAVKFLKRKLNEKRLPTCQLTFMKVFNPSKVN